MWIDNQKGYFTLPLKISINAIYDRIKLSYEYLDVELIHSSMVDVYLSENISSAAELQQRKQLAKLHCNPLIITTVDQIFKFVFQAKGFEFILATLSYSKIVIDEIQMYDPDILACLVYGLKIIQEYGGKFLVMTATFPKYLRTVMTHAGIDFKNTKESVFLIDKKLVNHRHRIKVIGKEIPIDLICKENGNKKILVIANTVSHAQNFYKQLSEEGLSPRLLHSRFLRKDRKELAEDIFESGQLESSKKEIWITTQIVEASLDIDFDILFTELCSIDSFIQRIGRVYRKRYKYDSEEPNVYVVDNRNIGRGKIIDPDIYEGSKRAILK